MCDDGNKNNGDGCLGDCSAVEEGWTCTENAVTHKSECSPICGDGLILGDEVCDDNNTNDGDGCSADCKKIE